jgi:hypothetical protein
MTPEERQMLAALANRIKAAPTQQRDQEADSLLHQLVQQRPDTAYLLAQTVLMQDLAMRNAQAQITDLQRQLEAARNAAPTSGSGSFLSGLFGSSPPPPPQAAPQYRAPGPAAPPRSGPWTQSAPRPVYATAPGALVLQPSQTSSFLQQAATTAVGIAGGALLFEGIQSLFGPHYGGFVGGPWGGGGFLGGGWGPTESLSETTIINNNNYYDDSSNQVSVDQNDQSGGFQDTGSDSNQDFSDDDDFGGSDDSLI